MLPFFRLLLYMIFYVFLCVCVVEIILCLYIYIYTYCFMILFYRFIDFYQFVCFCCKVIGLFVKLCVCFGAKLCLFYNKCACKKYEIGCLLTFVNSYLFI